MPLILSRKFAAAALALAVFSSDVQAQGLAGPYLAAHHASKFSDYAAAAQYYSQALAADPTNRELSESAIMSFVGLGRIDGAIPVARHILQGGVDVQVANLILLADQLKRGDYAAALADQAAGRDFGPLVDGLVSAWCNFGQGRMSEAVAAFDTVAAEKGLGAFGLYHKALALAAVGDFEGAGAIFASDAGSALLRTRRGALAYVQVLSQLERTDEAVTLLDTTFGTELDPGMQALRERLTAKQALPFDTIRNAQDGLAEVFFTVASALNNDGSDVFALLYSRLAEYLRTDHVDAILLTSGLLEAQDQFDLATASYLRVPASDPAFYAAELGRAETLEKSGKDDAAVEVLTQLAKTHAQVPIVHVTLGDMLSRQKRYAESIRAYDAAIALLGPAEPPHWVVYYARGIAQEREKNWPRAESDFRTALDLNPGQPQVLNYLGYSYVEKGQNLDEALDMIERAVAAQPDSGYITDSLGWAFFQLGRYEEAVPQMERAVELLPVDPVVNDHLGDVLWAVGRRLEAEFQWRRALSFDPEETDARRIRRKLEVGLDAVLAEEGKKPLSVAHGD